MIEKDKKVGARRGRSRSKRTTIQQVAEAAKVSIYTVSRTLNNAAGVNPQTREHVLEICRQLGMRPRLVSRLKHFALVIPDPDKFVEGAYVTNVVFHMLTEISARGMGLTVFHDNRADLLNKEIFDGVFALSWSEASVERLKALESTAIVVINRFSLAGSFDVVGWDHRAEGKTVANYLIERGHRRLAFIALPPPHRNSTQNRLKGYGEACQASGVDLDPGRVELIEADHQLAPAISRVIDRGADAIFVPGQERGGILALGFIQRSLKLRIPEDISLIGGENPGWSALFDPPLTTVDAPFGLLAQRSVDHMLSLIDHSPTKSTEVFIGTNIIERKSVMIRPQKS